MSDDKNKLNEYVAPLSVTEPLSTTMVASLGGSFKDRNAQNIWANAAQHEKGNGLPVVAINDIAFAGSEVVTVDTHIDFDFENINVRVEASAGTFMSGCDIHTRVVAPIHDKTKRTTTGVNVILRNLSTRPTVIKAGEVIGYIYVTNETKTVMSVAE